MGINHRCKMSKNFNDSRIPLGGVSLKDGIGGQALVGALNLQARIRPNPTAGQATNAKGDTEPNYYLDLVGPAVIQCCGLWEKQGNSGTYLIGRWGFMKVLALPNRDAGKVDGFGAVQPDYELFGLPVEKKQAAKPKPAMSGAPRLPKLPTADTGRPAFASGTSDALGDRMPDAGALSRAKAAARDSQTIHADILARTSDKTKRPIPPHKGAPSPITNPDGLAPLLSEPSVQGAVQ